MELWRRVIFYACFTVGLLLFMYANLVPTVYIEIYEPNKKKESFVRQQEDRREIKENKLQEMDSKTTKVDDESECDEIYSKLNLCGPLFSEETIREIEEKKLQEIASKTIRVDDENEWKEIYLNLKALQEQKSNNPKTWNISDDLKRRLPGDEYLAKVFFFLLTERPVNKLSNYFKTNGDDIYLHLSSLNGYLRVNYKTYSDNDFLIGSGFLPLPRPPDWILYPYRNIAVMLFIIGFLFFIFLPYKRISKDALRFQRWRVIVGEIILFLLIAFFFGMPLSIAGGTVQAFTIAAPVTIVMWLISLLYFYSIKIAAWYASYQLLPLDEGIKIATYKGVNLFRYDEMEYFQPVIFRPPKWLIVATAMGGRSTAGRAILLSSSHTGTIGIRLKNGRELYITVTDQMGTTALKGFEKVIEKLRSSGVKELDEVKEIRSAGFEILK